MTTGHWTSGVSHPGSAFTCGYDLIVDNDIYMKYKALFDTFFAASRFGVLKADYLGDLMTAEREALVYDPDYFGGVSPIFDFKRKTFRPWSRSSFKKGYTAQVSLPLGPVKRRWTERVCWAVIEPHLRQHTTPTTPGGHLGDPALCSMREQQPPHMAITVAHPQRECYFLSDYPSPSSITLDALAGLPSSVGVSWKRQREREMAAARRAAADDPVADADTDEDSDSDLDEE